MDHQIRLAAFQRLDKHAMLYDDAIFPRKVLE